MGAYKQLLAVAFGGHGLMYFDVTRLPLLVAFTVVLLTAGIVQAAPPTVILVRTDGDTKIADLLPAEQRKLETRKLAAKAETAKPSAIVTKNEVRFVAADGQTLKTVQRPPDMKAPGQQVDVILFGRGAAYYLSSLHQPGSPYDLLVMSAKSEKRVKRAGHTIFSISVAGDDDSGAQYLAVQSMQIWRGTWRHEVSGEHHRIYAVPPRPPGDGWRVEVFRDDGEVAWEFPGMEATGIAVRGDRAVAVRAGRRSTVKTANRTRGRIAELRVDNTLHNAAFLSDGSAILLWGSGDAPAAVLVDLEGTHVLWKTLLDHEGGFYPRQLSSTSSVLPVSGTVSTVARKQMDDKDRWQVRLYSLDIKTGAVVAVTPLFEQTGQDGIVLMSRHRDGDKERLSIGSREYELAPRKAGRD